MGIRIGNREIGPDAPPFVMAEVGINHEGSFEKAIQLVDAAAEAKADCVKFQCHITEAEMIPTDMKPGEISDELLWDIIKRCELTEDEERKVKAYCEKKGILYLSTPFSREAADRLESMGVAAYKIGSGECNNIPLLAHIAKWGKPIILSTGMNDIEAIRKSVDVIKKYDCPVMLMHCTSMYPTPYDKVRLGAIGDLMKEFSDMAVGLSDHSLGIYTCLGAVALGACALEKHFTITRDWPGPDVSISIEPHELAEMVKGARAVWEARGGRKNILDEEKPVIDFAYACAVTIAPVMKGEQFTLKNTWIKRPGNGLILAKDLDRVLGKEAKRDLKVNAQIEPDDIIDW
ncbi:N-acetylneuraminate synthase family protein [Verrucomicrobiota bacterium]